MKTCARLAAAAALICVSGAAWSQDVRIMWYSDGNEGEVLADLLTRFSAENPDINVIVDNVSYQTVMEQLPIALEGGSGPDIARVTNLKLLADHWLDLTPYLSDPAYWQENFGENADWLRPDGSDAITGFLTQITLTGGFVNKTLFDQAGVAVPATDATWDDWIAASAQVAQDQGLAAGFTVDRSGHRVSGATLSYGANYIGPDGLPAPLDEGARAFLTKLVGWSDDGSLLKDSWVAASGATYRAGADEFINAQIPFYLSGSWQVSNISSKVGIGFDWVAVPPPCGPVNCTPMTGGAGLVAVKYTEQPEAVARVMEYLAQADIQKEFAERTLFLPAHKGVAAGALDYQTEDPQVRAALQVFLDALPTLSDEARALPSWPWATVYYGAMVGRISQAMAGELTLEDAFARIDSDIEEQVRMAAP